MSLRDQLLKAGLADKKQARKAKNQAKTEQRKKKKQNKGAKKQSVAGPNVLKDKISEDIEAQKNQQKAIDKELNQTREEQRKAEEVDFQIQSILSSARQNASHGKIIYFFKNNVLINNLQVTRSQQFSLARGELGIIADIQDESIFHLIAVNHCIRIKQTHPHLVICLHEKLKPGEKLEED